MKKIVAAILIITVSAVFWLWYRTDVFHSIENGLAIDLSDDVTVVEKQRKVEYGQEHLKVKMLIHPEKLRTVEEKLNGCFSGNAKGDKYPDFGRTCSWWEFRETQVVLRYDKMVSGKRAKTVEIWAFVVKEQQDSYLYISY